MNDAPHQPTPADPASHEPFEARPEDCADAGPREPDQTDEFVRMLKRLAVIGMALTEDLVADAREAIAVRRAARAARVAAAAAAPAGSPAVSESGPELELTPEEMAARDPAMLAFDRMTRSLRLCMALAKKFQDDRQGREQKAAAEHAEVEEKRKARRKEQIKHTVQQAIEAEVKAGRLRRDGAQYYLNRTLHERLDHEDIERDLARCSLSELIGRICRGLGIKPNWDLWRQQFWALEEARLRTPGSPYADAPPAETPKAEASQSKAPKPEPAEPKAAATDSPEPEPAEAEPAKAEPPARAPDRTEADEPKSADLKPAEGEPPEARPPDAQPPDTRPNAPAAAPPPRAFDYFRPPSPEQKRAMDEHAARVRAIYYNRG